VALRGIREQIETLQERMGLGFGQRELLLRAVTHSSWVNEHPECSWGDNERLEYLGDAVLDLLATEYLYERFVHLAEGELTRLRADLVRSDRLGSFAGTIGLGEALLLGKGEERANGRQRAAMLGDAFEALLGALYLDQGLEVTRAFVLPFLEGHVEDLGEQAASRDAKSQLQEWVQERIHETPSYQTVEESGPDHDKHFVVEVRIQGESFGIGRGTSKQAAEQAAAHEALQRLEEPGDSGEPQP